MPKRKFSAFSKFPARRGLTKRQKRQVKRIAYKSGEQKYVGFELSATSIDNSTGVNKFLLDIPQGDDQGNRQGDCINVDRFVAEGAITFSDVTNIVRVVVASQPASGTTSLLPYYNSVSKWVDIKANGIKVWRDFIMTGGNSGPVAKRFKLNIPFKKRGQPGMKVTYNATSGLSLPDGEHHLCLFFISDSGSPSYPTVSWKGTLYYHDN